MRHSKNSWKTHSLQQQTYLTLQLETRSSKYPHNSTITCVLVKFPFRSEGQPSKSFIDHVVSSCIKIPLLHPTRVVGYLIQFGYEPVDVTRHYSFILRRHLYYYPGLIGYSKAITNQWGWRALYRGLFPGIAEEIVTLVAGDYFRGLTTSLVNKLPLTVMPGDGEETPDNVENITTTRATLVRAVKGFLVLSISKCAVEVVTRPFHVITARTIAQHVGQEAKYTGVVSAVKQIFAEEGVRGFYSGLVPALLYHVFNSLLYEMIIVIVEESAKIVPVVILKAGLVTIKVPLAAYITRSYTYPLSLIGNVMAINNSGLEAARLNPSFASWKDCWRYLKDTGNSYRGNVILLPRFAHNHPLNKL